MAYGRRIRQLDGVVACRRLLLYPIGSLFSNLSATTSILVLKRGCVDLSRRGHCVRRNLLHGIANRNPAEHGGGLFLRIVHCLDVDIHKAAASKAGVGTRRPSASGCGRLRKAGHAGFSRQHG